MLNMLELRSKVSATVWDKLMSYDSVWAPATPFSEWLHGAMLWHDTDEGNDFWHEVYSSNEPHTLLNQKINPTLERGSTWIDFEKLLSIPAIDELRRRNVNHSSPAMQAHDWIEDAFAWAQQPEGDYPYEFWYQIKRDLERYDYPLSADRINYHIVYSVDTSKSWREFEQLLSPSAVQHVRRYCSDYPIIGSIGVDGEAHMWLTHTSFKWCDTPQGDEWWREIADLLENKKWETAAMKINEKFNITKPKPNKVMEKIYELTGDSARGVVQQYHSKPSPLKHSAGAGKSDIKCFGRKKKRLTMEEWSGSYESRYTIGMEVEKTSLHRDSIHEHILFTGIERDGSCGYEAVTHILPLIPESKWRNKVFALMWDAEKIIDDRYSAGDNSCGGHITVGVQGLSGDELREKLRPYAGILYALFRHRIKNKYCGANIRMAGRNDDHGMVMNSTDYNGWRDRECRYQVALVKGNVLEFRLPSRFKSVKQMQNRYELMFEMIDYAVNSKRQSHEEFLRKIRPILMDMYHSNEQVNKLLQMAREMRVFIMEGRIHPNINKYVNPTGHWDSMVIKVETKRKRNVTREETIYSAC